MFILSINSLLSQGVDDYMDAWGTINEQFNYIPKFGNIVKDQVMLDKSIIFELDNKIGIGVPSPETKLHINGDFSLCDNIYFYSLTGNEYMIRFYGDMLKFTAANTGPFNDILKLYHDYIIVNGIIETNGFRMTTSATEGHFLRVDGNGYGTWQEYVPTLSEAYNGPGGSGSGRIINADNGAVKIQGTGGLIIDGSVGIGTNNPPGASKLFVEGKLTTKDFRLWVGTTEDALGMVLQADADGNGSWVEHWNISNGNIYRNSGNVGIGTNDPQSRLHVNGDVFLLSTDFRNQLQILGNEQIPERRGISISDDSDGAFNFYIHSWQSDAAFNFIDALNNNNLMTIKEDGSVGIGTTETTGYKLAVSGFIHAEEVKIEHADKWYDFVFENDYDLPKLNELEKFITENKHLPDVPSAKEVKENGINLGEMNGILLKKIEELTLYVIEQQKEIEKLKKKIQ